MDNHQHINQTSGNTEWYSPHELVEAARRVMGGIDLDPASSRAANEAIVKAIRYFDKEQDGLSKDWYGKIWMNKKGVCSCPCHKEHANGVGNHTQKRLNISIATGSSLEQFALSVGEERPKTEPHVLDAESVNHFMWGIVAEIVSMNWSENEGTGFQNLARELSEHVQNVAGRNQPPLTTSTEEGHPGMGYLPGVGNVIENMPESRPVLPGLHLKGLRKRGKTKSDIEPRKGAWITKGDDLSLITQDGESVQQEHLYSGACRIGNNARTIGQTGALIVGTQDCLHRIISSLFHPQIAQELSPEILCQLASLATTLRETSPLLNGAKQTMPWKLSFITSPTCSDCAGCCCIKHPANLWLNHPFGNSERACQLPNCKKKTCVDRGWHTAVDIPGNKEWIQRLVSEYSQGHITQAVCLTYAATSEAWFRPLKDFPMCIMDGRVNYLDPATMQSVKGVTKGSVVTYLGPDVDKFVAEFDRFGAVMVRVRPPRPKVTQAEMEWAAAQCDAHKDEWDLL